MSEGSGGSNKGANKAQAVAVKREEGARAVGVAGAKPPVPHQQQQPVAAVKREEVLASSRPMQVPVALLGAGTAAAATATAKPMLLPVKNRRKTAPTRAAE